MVVVATPHLILKIDMEKPGQQESQVVGTILEAAPEPPPEVTKPLPATPILDDGLGESQPLGPITVLPTGIEKQDLILQYRQTIQSLIGQASSKREVLEIEIDSLAECIGVAAEMYKT